MHFIADGNSNPNLTFFFPKILLLFVNQMKINSISVLIWFSNETQNSQPVRRNQRGKIFLWNKRINITVLFNLFIFLSLTRSLTRRTLLSEIYFFSHDVAIVVVVGSKTTLLLLLLFSFTAHMLLSHSQLIGDARYLVHHVFIFYNATIITYRQLLCN